MNNLKNILILPNTKIRDTMEILNLYSLQITLVVDESNKLLGTITDGDIRRGILAGISLEDSVESIMNKNPKTITGIRNKRKILEIMKKEGLRHMPIVDETGIVIGIERLEDLVYLTKNENWVVLMAGGLGSRLRPLTDDCPKPMLKIGDKPLLETILNNFIGQGFYKFCISVNYKGNQIMEYFKDGSKLGVEIHYIVEDSKMGTAGSLSLFSQETDLPIIVMNGDILTNINFQEFIEFHNHSKTKATIAVRSYDFQIPYGIVKVNKNRLIGFDEKPVFSNYINAGIYAINPEVLEKIPKKSYFDMNNLFAKMLDNNEKIAIYPIRDYWIDIGEIDDFNQALADFDEVFK